MGKNKKNNKNNSQFPFVSICTPTFNRRPFIPAMIKCFQHQDYPKDRMEWIIIDDGTDKIEDMVKHVPQVKYFKYDQKMTLGKKRNLMHEKSKGDIIVYMDDDDYYPPNRVSHAVEKLLGNSEALCAGSSIMYIWFKHINQMWQFGPYGPNHSTAGTFAFKRKLLDITRYNENASLAEEKEFLKNYTIPFVQLDPDKVILVFSHEHNTFDKKILLENPDPRVCRPVTLTVDNFIKDNDLKQFYTIDIEKALKEYSPGRPDMKPDVLKQIEEIQSERKKIMDEYKKSSQMQSIMVQEQGKEPRVLNTEEIINLLSQQRNEIDRLNRLVDANKTFIDLLKNKLNEKDRIIKELESYKITVSDNLKQILKSGDTNLQDKIIDDNIEMLLKEINE